MVERALHRALALGHQGITREDFESERLDTAKLLRIAQENGRGLATLRALDEGEGDLRRLLGLPSREPVKKANASGLKPGQRKLQRDPVGMEVAA